MADDFDPYYQWLAIPPKHQPPNHYRLLGVEEFESNLDVIENAADQRMQHVRSFQNGPQGEASQRLLNEITAAKLCLLNLARKAEYDQKLRAEKDAAEPRRLKPLARLAQTALPTVAYRIASEIPAAVPTGHKVPGLRLAAHQKAMIAAALATLLLSVILFVAFSGVDWNTAIDQNPTPSDSDIGKTAVESQAAEKSRQPVDAESRPAPKTADSVTESIFLDDLQDVNSEVGHGALGKHGNRGYSNAARHSDKTVFQGKAIVHALSMHPPPSGASQVTYELGGVYEAFRATAALLDVEGEAQAGSPVLFKVVGDGRVIWQSSPLQRLKTGEECAVNIDGVKTLRVEVHCTGDHNYAVAAWLNPKVTKESTGPVVYLDDLEEKEFKIGHGTLGKHGYSGHPTLPEAIFQGAKVPHTLVTPPASRLCGVRVERSVQEFSRHRGAARGAARNTHRQRSHFHRVW